jgi:hypothetical protein
MFLDRKLSLDIYQHILKTFAETGRPPSPDALITTFRLPDAAALNTHLNAIATAGCIYRDPTTGEILGAYPFSATPTAHRVKLGAGSEVYAMCAIDALGMSAMFDTDVSIRSTCPHCGSGLAIEVKEGTFVTGNPAGIAVGYTEVSAADCCPAIDQCPFINFFCSPEHMRAWQEKQPHLALKTLTLSEALNRGRLVFGNVLRVTGTSP